MSLSFYQERLIQLMQVPNPSFLMKRVIDTLRSDTEKVYIYELHPGYASLFLSDDTRSIYFYPNLECSLLKPPDEHYTPDWKKWIDTTNAPVLDLEWIRSILQTNTTERHDSDDFSPTIASHSPKPIEPNSTKSVMQKSVISEPFHSPQQLSYIKKINSILRGKPSQLKKRPIWK
jgi:hypothetical protein